MFADDTSLTIVSDKYVSTNEMNCEIQTVDDWLKLDKCSLTYSKSEYNGSQYKERIICNFHIKVSGLECIMYLEELVQLNFKNASRTS